MDHRKVRVTNRDTAATHKGFDIPDRKHREILKSGSETWNRWRADNPDIRPSLGYTRLRRVDLSGYNFDHAWLPFSVLSRCIFQGASFKGADLRGASFRRADLTRANLEGAILRHASLAECTVKDTIFSCCETYSISAWNLSDIIENQKKGED